MMAVTIGGVYDPQHAQPDNGTKTRNREFLGALSMCFEGDRIGKAMANGPACCDLSVIEIAQAVVLPD